MPQEQFLRQDVVAQGNVQLGDDSSDIVNIAGGALVIGGQRIVRVPSATYGPGPLTNEVIYSFAASGQVFYESAVLTVTVSDDANDDVYMASFNIAHAGGTATLSTAYGEVDVWGGTNPTFNAFYSSGTGPGGSDEVQLRMNIADSVSVAVALDAKLHLAVASPEITIGVQPTNESVTAPAPVAFNLTATTNDGGTLTYQWEVDDGVSGFVNATGGVYSGDTTDTLGVTDSTGLNGYQFRCTVTSDATASPVTSSTVTLTVA